MQQREDIISTANERNLTYDSRSMLSSYVLSTQMQQREDIISTPNERNLRAKYLLTYQASLPLVPFSDALQQVKDVREIYDLLYNDCKIDVKILILQW